MHSTFMWLKQKWESQGHILATNNKLGCEKIYFEEGPKKKSLKTTCSKESEQWMKNKY